MYVCIYLSIYIYIYYTRLAEGSMPSDAAGWPSAGGMANSIVRLALAKSR